MLGILAIFVISNDKQDKMQIHQLLWLRNSTLMPGKKLRDLKTVPLKILFHNPRLESYSLNQKNHDLQFVPQVQNKNNLVR